MTPTGFAAALQAQLPPPLQRRFSSVEAVPQCQQHQVDVSPEGGTLVLFDSVTVPHEVRTTTAGERIAIAGWFHEEQQEFPDWYEGG